jgi:hypothetical protein
MLTDGALTSGRTCTLAYSSPLPVPPDQDQRLRVLLLRDIWSAAAIAFEVLTGEMYDKDKPKRLIDIDPEIPREVDFIVYRALDHRYATAKAFKEDLERFLDHKPIPQYSQTFWYKGRKFCRRSPWTAATIIALAIGLLVSSFFEEKSRMAAKRINEQAAELHKQQLRLEHQSAQLRDQIERQTTTLAALDDILFKVDPDERRQRALTVDYLLEGYLQTARTYSGKVPEAAAPVLMAAGRIYDNSELSDHAIGPLKDGVALYRTIAQFGNRNKLENGLNWLSWAYTHQQPPLTNDALVAAQECWELRRARLGVHNIDTLAAMADLASMELRAGLPSGKDRFLDCLALFLVNQGTVDQLKAKREEIQAEIGGILLQLNSSPDNRDSLHRFVTPFLKQEGGRLRHRLHSHSLVSTFMITLLPSSVFLKHMHLSCRAI